MWLAVYDADTLARLSFDRAPASGVNPIYGYAVASDGEYTYLFGNTFEQNLDREGGFHDGPHSGTRMFLARVPLGQLTATPEYRTDDGWSGDPAAATPIVSRYWAENPMQPRYLNGQWVAATKVDGYWGEELSIDVAADPWGPWSNTERRALLPRDGDPLMNTYQAHLMPWLSGGALVVSVSQNARDMRRDAYPHPVRYRLQFFSEPLVAPHAARGVDDDHHRRGDDDHRLGHDHRPRHHIVDDHDVDDEHRARDDHDDHQHHRRARVDLDRGAHVDLDHHLPAHRHLDTRSGLTGRGGAVRCAPTTKGVAWDGWTARWRS